MKDANIEKSSTNYLVERYVQILNQGIALLQNLNDAVYTYQGEFDRGSIGSHFRHTIDFAGNFLNGFKVGKIDYNRRERDINIEQKKDFALARFKAVVNELNDLPPNIANKQVLVHLETDENMNGEASWCISSVLREIEFLQSHTLHHYALIAAKLSGLGIRVDKEFGVSPSTLEFWEKEKTRKKMSANK